MSEEQQQAAIQNQLGDSAFFRHLYAFSTIRREHDRIYRSVAFPSLKERTEIEGLVSVRREGCAPPCALPLLLVPSPTVAVAPPLPEPPAAAQLVEDADAQVRGNHRCQKGTAVRELTRRRSTGDRLQFSDGAGGAVTFTVPCAPPCNTPHIRPPTFTRTHPHSFDSRSRIF